VELADTLTGSDAANGGPFVRGPWRALWQRALRLPLLVRYLTVSGVVGVPASIAQLTVMIWLYERARGDIGLVPLNLLWLVNFELSLMRNFLLHCLLTFRAAPTWRRIRHTHVAASGAAVLSAIVFNLVVRSTDVIPLAQLAGAGAGFAINFTYNSLKTFARDHTDPAEAGLA
jgi:putative flippase GtrA